MEHDPWWFALHLITIEMDFKTTDPSPGWWCSSTQEAEAVRSLQIWGLLSKALSQNHSQKNRNQNQKNFTDLYLGKESELIHSSLLDKTKALVCLRWETFLFLFQSCRVIHSWLYKALACQSVVFVFSCVCLVRINLWMASSPSACSGWGTGRLRFWMSYPRSWCWCWWW